MSPVVSVVIPAYNAGLYLKQTLESVLAQSYRDYEIIVVDDGSTDDTSQVALQFGDSIRYIHQSNQGLSAARNTAIKNARGEIIALLDSDDLWEPGYLEKMVPELNLHPEAAGVYCGFQYVNSRSEVVGQPSIKVVPPELFHSEMVIRGNWLAPCAVLFRKCLVKEVGLFDEALHAVEDWDMWIRLSENYIFVGVPDALVKYRRHENNMTKDPERMIKAIGQLTVKLYGSPEDDVALWSPAKKRAFSSHYRGGAISFFTAGRIQKSVEYLKKLAEVSPEAACSLDVWRGFARAHIPIEYQFDPSSHHDWALIQVNLNSLFRELEREENGSSGLHQVPDRLKGFAFLGAADEAARYNEPVEAGKWLMKTIQADPRMLAVRPFWGTLGRCIVFRIGPRLKARGLKAAVR
jgi:glycosyltransferase involved in cell wall biosynthesis